MLLDQTCWFKWHLYFASSVDVLFSVMNSFRCMSNIFTVKNSVERRHGIHSHVLLLGVESRYAVRTKYSLSPVDLVRSFDHSTLNCSSQRSNSTITSKNIKKIWRKVNRPVITCKWRMLVLLWERFSNEYRNTKTKVTTPANHNKHKLPNEQIRTRSNYM